MPLTVLVGFLSRHKNLPPRIKSIGLIQPTAIGDVILCSGLIAKLAELHPGLEIHLFHGISNKAAVALLDTPVIAHCCNFRQPLSTINELRRQPLDVLIDLCPWSNLTALISRCSGAKCTVGFRSRRQYRHLVFDIAVPHSCLDHELQNLNAIVRLFGPSSNYAFSIRDQYPTPSLQLPYGRLVVMHACPGGSRSAAKSWPRDYWVELAQSVVDAGWVVVFSGAPADARQIGEIILAVDRGESCFSLAGLLNLEELAYVIQHARLIVTVDTGILHLAAALDARVIGLHGPTASWRWGATNSRAHGLDADHPLAGYICFGFETVPGEMEIMKCLYPSVVISQVMKSLADKRQGHVGKRDVTPAFRHKSKIE